MKRFVWLLLLLGLEAHAAAEEFKIRAQFLNANGEHTDNAALFETTVGSKVTIAVDILTNGWFLKAPKFSRLSVQDAVSLKAESFATNFSERIGSTTYAVQRREYTLFPQRSGPFAISGIEVKVWSSDTSDAPKQAHTLRAKPLLLLVNALPSRPDGVVADTIHRTPPLVATAVVLQQSIKPQPKNLGVGDLIERQVEIQASNTLAMLIPPLTWPEAKNIAQTSLSPSLDDHMNRGEFVGVRRETRQYTLMDDGDLILPAISLRWWDGQTWRLSELPEYRLQGVTAKFDNHATGFEYLRNIAAFKHPSAFYLILLAIVLVSVFWLALTFVSQGYHARNHLLSSERWLRFQLILVLWLQSPKHVVIKFYQWRNASRRPLQPIPNEFELSWALWWEAAQTNTTISFRQRSTLLKMVSNMQREAVAQCLNDISVSASASVPLQPLNPK